MNLPEPLFFTVAEEAFETAEQLKNLYQFQIYQEGNIFILGEKPCLTSSQSSTLLSSSH